MRSPHFITITINSRHAKASQPSIHFIRVRYSLFARCICFFFRVIYLFLFYAYFIMPFFFVLLFSWPYYTILYYIHTVVSYQPSFYLALAQHSGSDLHVFVLRFVLFQ
ncbi:hypothetical protein JB92DRAFT_24109 [Gautieria morchelliformis]|nr:hypothetical protein JB92DRAFT_24109 [Gautieria morchelliformis]